MFASSSDCRLAPNSLGLCLQPDEGVHLKFETKVPGEGIATQPVDMEFHYADSFRDRPLPEAYERLLQDALAGDASLFIRSDHIEEAWRIVDPLLAAWEDPSSSPHIYEPGSWGPEATDALLAQNGHAWLPGCCHD
jgi:glucose-6-phosphate 1-dehydrogenase